MWVQVSPCKKEARFISPIFYENGDKQIKCIHFTIYGNFEPTSQLNLQKFNESE